MPSRDLISETDSPERQLDKFRRITNALIRRAERDAEESANAFRLFQRATELESEVRARTRDLNETLAQLNRANEKLEAASASAAEANRAKSRFLAAASHDVMQPLNAAKLFIDSLRVTPLDAAQARTLDQLESAFGSVEAILGALLNISKLDTRAIEPEISSFPVSNLLDRIASEFVPLAAARGVAFDYVKASVWVRSDPTYLRQIVQNLVSNAIRYCEGSRVLLGCRRRGTSLRIEVHDIGPGIAEADLKVIFEEFRRLRPGSGGDGEGLGLGLAIVERACRQLDHPLHVRSEPGRGSTFAVDVPVASAGAHDDADETEDTMIALVVTADQTLSGEITALLDSWQMGALVAGTAAEAQNLVAQIGVVPDALLLDEALGADALDFEGCPKLMLRRDTARPMPPERFIAVDLPILPHRLRASLEYARTRNGADASEQKDTLG